MELLRDYHAMFWVCVWGFFFGREKKKTFSLIQYLFIATTFPIYVTEGGKEKITERKEKGKKETASFSSLLS